MGRLIIFWLVLYIPLLLSLFASETSHRQEYILNIDNDQFTLGTNGGLYPISLADVKDNDTARVMDVDTLIVYGSVDSLVIPSSPELVPVTLKAPFGEKNIFIWFDITPTQIDEYVALLRQYNKFGNSSAANFGNFRYSPRDDSSLVKLNKKFNLDSIAGDGADFERAMNLMSWAHTIVRHDGSSSNPDPRDALNIIQVCADSGRGVNCRMMATILNEACLAVGLKSRHLTCLPYDTADTDCHVVVMVWSDSLDKWIMLDPTFRGYFTSSKGEILGPNEIREAFIRGDLPNIGSDIDYNGSPHNPAQYRSYMAKNLFRFLAPLESSFGYESKGGDICWVTLNPLGYNDKLTGTADSTTRKDGFHIDYFTDNAARFWQE